MKQWTPAGKYGLRYREHEDKTVGVGRNKRPLRYYTQVYKWEGRTVTDSYGWEGEDFRNEDEIITTVLELRQNRRNLTPPFTLREKIAMREEEIEDSRKKKESEDAQKELQKRLILKNIFEEYEDANSHKKSLKDETNYFKNWIEPYIGSKRLDEIVLLDLERIRKKMTTAGKAQRSIQYVKSIIRQVYHFAMAHQLYSGDVPTTNFLKKQTTDNRRQRYLSPAEAEELLAKVREYSETTYQISLVSLHTGMRFGEIASLLWQHINIQNREMLVIDPKNSETRSVFMTDRVLQLLTSMERGRPNELVFPSNTGGKRGRVSKVFAQAVNDLKLNEGITDRRLQVVFHTLRHSCASTLVNAGIAIPVIAKILGHKTLAMTMRYSHISNNSVRNAMAVFNNEPAMHKKEKVQAIK